MQQIAPIFDSHSHYTDPAFDADRDALLTGFPEKGVRRCTVCGTNLADIPQCLALAERYPELLITAVGIHPECISGHDAPPEFPTLPADWLSRVREYAKHESVRAIGEIGLDYHYEGYDRAAQHRVFTEQLALAKELRLPVILHCRDAIGDMISILRDFAPLEGVMHCFPGSAETAQECLQMGLYIGFTGVITFKNAKKPLAALRAVPADRLLIETDCPYMAPVPYRGKRCDSTMLVHTAEAMAREKGVSTEEMLRITAENAARLFRSPL